MFFRNNKKCNKDVYISDPIDTDHEGNTLTLIDVIANEDNIVEDIDKKIKKEKLSEYINEVLTEREKKIIILRYGLSGKRELPQREVAKKLNISRSYVSRIEKKALNKLFLRFNQKN